MTDSGYFYKNLAALLGHLLEQKADSARQLAAMWKEKPEEYGASAEDIGCQCGRKEAFDESAKLIRSYIVQIEAERR